MTDVPESKVIESLEIGLATLGKVEGKLNDFKNEVDKRTKALLAEYAPHVDELTELREVTLAQITEIFQQHRGFLIGEDRKTVTLRGGTLSARLAAEALKIEDDAAAEKFLRKKGRWLKHSKAVKRKLDKAALKKDRALVESAPDSVMRFARDENLIIKLPKLQLEIKRLLNPLRTSLKKS